MKVEPRSEHPMTDAEVKARTGKTWAQWNAFLDEAIGTAAGRKATTELLMKDQRLEAWWAQTIAVEYEGARRLHEKDGRPKGYSICVTKTIAAPAEAVFDAFGDKKALETWLGGSVTVKLVEKGRLATSDGNRGTFTKVARPKMLRFTWDDSDPALASTVEVKLMPNGKKCGLVLNHERIQTRPLADGLRQAWLSAVDRLKQWLER